MMFRPFYHFETGCAGYVFGCVCGTGLSGKPSSTMTFEKRCGSSQS